MTKPREEHLLKGARVRLSERALRTRESPISTIMAQALANPDVISLAAGFVDQDLAEPSDFRCDVQHWGPSSRVVRRP